MHSYTNIVFYVPNEKTKLIINIYCLKSCFYEKYNWYVIKKKLICVISASNNSSSELWWRYKKFWRLSWHWLEVSTKCRGNGTEAFWRLLNTNTLSVCTQLHRRFMHRCHEVVIFLTDKLVVCAMNGCI